MRALLLCLLLAGCATEPPARDCPELPKLRTTAQDMDMAAHIRTITGLYVRCAAGPQ